MNAKILKMLKKRSQVLLDRNPHDDEFDIMHDDLENNLIGDISFFLEEELLKKNDILIVLKNITSFIENEGNDSDDIDNELSDLLIQCLKKENIIEKSYEAPSEYYDQSLEFDQDHNKNSTDFIDFGFSIDGKPILIECRTIYSPTNIPDFSFEIKGHKYETDDVNEVANVLKNFQKTFD